MFRRYITTPVLIRIILCLQIVPLLAMPASSYSLGTQEWWLPAFLAILSVISLVKLIPGKSLASWPWYLLAFSQGFNIISRLMMLFPHATEYSEGVGMVADVPYIVLAIVSMLLSSALLLYCEMPEVRLRMTPQRSEKEA